MRSVIVASLVVAALVGPAGAADDPEEHARAVAREHYVKGNSFFDLGRYDEAIGEYEAAYQAKNDPALLYNIAQAHRLASHAAPALRFYKRYLARRPDARNRAEVEVKIAMLERLVEEQRKSQNIPPDQPLQPSGKPASSAPAATAAAGEVPSSAPVAESAPSSPDRHAGRTKKIAGLAMAGGGLALVAGGIACGVLAMNASDSLSSANRMHAPFDPRLYDTWQTDRTLEGALLAVGAAAVVGGGVVYFLGDREARRAARAEVAPAVSPRYAGVSLRVQY